MQAEGTGRAWGGALSRRWEYEVSPTDPVVYATVTATILATAGIASVLPAWRAASIDAAIALRSE